MESSKEVHEKCCLERFIGGIEHEYGWKCDELIVKSLWPPKFATMLFAFPKLNLAFFLKGPKWHVLDIFLGVYTTVMVWIFWHYCQTCPTFFRTKTASWNTANCSSIFILVNMWRALGEAGPCPLDTQSREKVCFFFGSNLIGQIDPPTNLFGIRKARDMLLVFPNLGWGHQLCKNGPVVQKIRRHGPSKLRWFWAGYLTIWKRESKRFPANSTSTLNCRLRLHLVFWTEIYSWRK